MHFIPRINTLLSAAAIFALCINTSISEDWPRFRGPNADATSKESVPIEFSESKNLKWKSPLPGPGSSSPIIVGNKVFLTCYSGYGLENSDTNVSKLQRHLVCLDKTTGKELWTKTVKGDPTEDRYRGFISEHGYASNTPVSDGNYVYSFFGKSGLYAYDMDGKQIWKADLGKMSSNREWGSGASPILLDDMVIMNAADEGRAVFALNKKTGKEIWKAPSDLLELSYATPIVATLPGGSKEIIVPVPGEVWSLSPSDGLLMWFAETDLTGNVSPSPQIVDNTVYLFGGFRSSGSRAIKIGGKDNVTKSNTKWKQQSTSYVATPVIYDGKFYWISDRGQAFCTNLKDGEEVYRKRVPELKSGGRPVYASPIVANDHIYYVSRRDGVLVMPAKPEFNIIAQNKFASDNTDFNATPAISDGELFLRSNKFAYCVSDK